MKKMIAQREAYGEALLDLGKANPNVVVLDADVSNSTRTVYFAEQFPGRFFNFGIAEQNMMAAAAGMAKCGLIPFVNTFSFLATYRAADQLRDIHRLSQGQCEDRGNLRRAFRLLRRSDSSVDRRSSLG